MSGQYNTIPWEDHFNVFKKAELQIRNHLATIGENEFLIGFRLAYDLVDPFSIEEPHIMPYSIEVGYLPPPVAYPFPEDMQSYSPSEDENQLTKWFPISFLDPFYDGLYNDLHALLDDQSASLKVSFSINVHGTIPQPISFSPDDDAVEFTLAAVSGGCCTNKKKSYGTNCNGSSCSNN